MSAQVNLLVTIDLEAPLLARLQEVSTRLQIELHPTRRAEDVPAEAWEKAEILYTTRALPTEEQAPNLRWIQFHMAGVDRDLGAPILQKPDLLATTLSGANAQQVAEHALTMLLALGHRLPAMWEHQSSHKWPSDRWTRFTPQELRGSTIGIVGYGSIGRRIAYLLKQFGATVLASKRDAMGTAEQDYTPDEFGDPQGELPRRIYPGEALRSMFKECDFVVVTVPLTEKTRGSIGAEQLAALKPTAFIVDVSRGGVIDHAALIEALQNNSIAGAALDVFPEEPLPVDSPLWDLPNVIISPHIAGYSAEYNARAVDLVRQNLERYLQAEPLLNLIDLQRGY